MALKHLTLPNGTTLDINDARSVVIGDDIYNVVALTSEEYQALPVKDENTLYIVTDSSGGGGGGGGDITPSATVHNSLISIIMNEETVGSFTTNSANAVNIDLGTVITQIKTINNQSLIGTGNITISGGGGSGDENVIEAITFNGAAVPVANKTAAITASTPGTLKTNNTSAQAASASESLSGTINLHKVSKTGAYSDLIGTPYIENFYFVEGSSSQAGNATSGSYLSTKWEGTVTGITTPTNGMKIAYRIATNTGVGTAGAVLSIDGGTTYYPVVYNVNSVISTRYSVGSTILITFNSTQTATAYLTSNTKSTVTGCWQIMDYDANSYAYVREYQHGDNAAGTAPEYPLLARYNVTNKNGSYDTAYSRYHTGATLNTNTGALTATSFIKDGATSSQVLLGDGSASELKTINNESILGSGNISISGGGSGEANVIEAITFNGSAVPVTNKTAAITASIPPEVTESTVSGWGFTKNTGTYSKPSGGIPATDLASAVQTSLGKADTALQSYTETDPIYSASAAAGITSSDISNWNSKTSNVGTITGITMNGASKGTSGVVDLGTVLTSYTETDPTVPSWAKASTKPTYTAAEVGALPSTTTIPSALSDLTDDATHRTVTDTEKSTWNAKQSAITISSSEPTSSDGSNGDIWIVI